MRYLHTMLRVRDLDAALDFFVAKLGLRELRRQQNEAGRFTLVFLGTGAEGDGAEIELTYNWDQSEPYPTGRFFGHLAYEVDDIYATCARLRAAGVAILRPPRDGHMAFIKSPDGHSVELLQRGQALPQPGAVGVDAQPGELVGRVHRGAAAPNAAARRRGATSRQDSASSASSSASRTRDSATNVQPLRPHAPGAGENTFGFASRTIA